MFELALCTCPIEMRWCGQSVRLRPMERVLIAALACAKDFTLPSTKLASMLLGASGGAQAVTLRRHVANIRRALRSAAGDVGAQTLRTVTLRNGVAYKLDISPGRVDILRWEQLLAGARAEFHQGLLAAAETDLAAALAMWGEGPFVDVTDWPFARKERSRLASVRHDARIDLADIRIAAGRPRDAVADLRALAAEEPGDRTVWERLVTCLSRAGREAEAADACRKAIQAFRKLGLATAALDRLQTRALRGEL